MFDDYFFSCLLIWLVSVTNPIEVFSYNLMRNIVISADTIALTGPCPHRAPCHMAQGSPDGRHRGPRAILPVRVLHWNRSEYFLILLL